MDHGFSSQRVEYDAKDPISARKIQKADREKMRRDRLNEQFLELGKTIDPDRPKNDKATILADTIHMLNDLTTQVNKLKTEHASLMEESRELTLEKNELREEKASLKSEIDSLNVQYQQRLRCVYPWAVMDPSVVMGPLPSYPYPMPVPLPAVPVPIHQLQPYHLFQNQTHGAIPNSCSSYVPSTSSCNPQAEHSSTRLPPHPHPSCSRLQTSSRNDSRIKPPELQQHSGAEGSDDFSDVMTELELKTPGSAGMSSHPRAVQDQDLYSEGCKEKQWPLQRKSRSNANGSTSSRCSRGNASGSSSSRCSSSSSVGGSSGASD